MKDARNIYEHLCKKGIIVRDRSKVVLCEDSLRITIGTPEENKQLIEELSKYKSKLNGGIKSKFPLFGETGGKRVLFIDRDGTIIKESPPTYQIDSFDKLEFYPGMFTWLSRIAKEFDYELVMATNQDGLGTASFPEETFLPVHNFILSQLRNEGINFSEVLIDKTFAKENAPTRKPGIGMFTKYLNNF